MCGTQHREGEEASTKRRMEASLERNQANVEDGVIWREKISRKKDKPGDEDREKKEGEEKKKTEAEQKKERKEMKEKMKKECWEKGEEILEGVRSRTKRIGLRTPWYAEQKNEGKRQYGIQVNPNGKFWRIEQLRVELETNTTIIKKENKRIQFLSEDVMEISKLRRKIGEKGRRLDLTNMTEIETPGRDIYGNYKALVGGIEEVKDTDLNEWLREHQGKLVERRGRNGGMAIFLDEQGRERAIKGSKKAKHPKVYVELLDEEAPYRMIIRNVPGKWDGRMLRTEIRKVLGVKADELGVIKVKEAQEGRMEQDKKAKENTTIAYVRTKSGRTANKILARTIRGWQMENSEIEVINTTVAERNIVRRTTLANTAVNTQVEEDQTSTAEDKLTGAKNLIVEGMIGKELLRELIQEGSQEEMERILSGLQTQVAILKRLTNSEKNSEQRQQGLQKQRMEQETEERQETQLHWRKVTARGRKREVEKEEKGTTKETEDHKRTIKSKGIEREQEVSSDTQESAEEEEEAEETGEELWSTSESGKVEEEREGRARRNRPQKEEIEDRSIEDTKEMEEEEEIPSTQVQYTTPEQQQHKEEKEEKEVGEEEEEFNFGTEESEEKPTNQKREEERRKRAVQEKKKIEGKGGTEKKATEKNEVAKSTQKGRDGEKKKGIKKKVERVEPSKESKGAQITDYYK